MEEFLSGNLLGAGGLAPLINNLESEDYFKLISAIENRINGELFLLIKNSRYRCKLNFKDLILTLFFNKVADTSFDSLILQLQDSLENFTSKLALENRSLSAEANNLIGLVGVLSNNTKNKIKYSLDVFLANLCRLTQMDLSEINIDTNFSLEIEPSTLSLIVYQINISKNIKLNINADNLEISFDSTPVIELVNSSIDIQDQKLRIPLVPNKYQGVIYVYEEEKDLNSTEIFESFNYKAVFFSDPNVLLCELINNEPDLILIDPPIFTGNKLIRQIKAIANCPVFGLINSNQFKIDSFGFKELDKIYAKPLNFSLIKKILTSDLTMSTSNPMKEIA